MQLLQLQVLENRRRGNGSQWIQALESLSLSLVHHLPGRLARIRAILPRRALAVPVTLTRMPWVASWRPPQAAEEWRVFETVDDVLGEISLSLGLMGEVFQTSKAYSIKSFKKEQRRLKANPLVTGNHGGRNPIAVLQGPEQTRRHILKPGASQEKPRQPSTVSGTRPWAAAAAEGGTVCPDPSFGELPGRGGVQEEGVGLRTVPHPLPTHTSFDVYVASPSLYLIHKLGGHAVEQMCQVVLL